MSKLWIVGLTCIGIAAGVAKLVASAASTDATTRAHVEATEMQKARDGGTCEHCFQFSVFDTYLAVPTRYAVQGTRKIDDGCVALVAPAPVPGQGIETPEYQVALKTQSGLIRYCRKKLLDLEVQQLEGKAKPTTVRVAGSLTIKTWSAAALSSHFTTTYIYSADSALLISDANPKFAELLWATGQRTP